MVHNRNCLPQGSYIWVFTVLKQYSNYLNTIPQPNRVTAHETVAKTQFTWFIENCYEFTQDSRSIVILFKYVYVNFNLSKNPNTRTLNFEGHAAVGSYLMIMNSNIRLLGS